LIILLLLLLIIIKKNFKNQKKKQYKVYAKFTWQHYGDEKRGKYVGAERDDEDIKGNEKKKDFYDTLMKTSIFSAVPRGDDLYSYRFSEVLSSGSIPVVYGDGYVLGYTNNVINWDEIAVLIPQRLVNETMNILKNISSTKICSMQRKGLEIYNKYIKDSNGRLRAILEVLDSAPYHFKQSVVPS